MTSNDDDGDDDDKNNNNNRTPNKQSLQPLFNILLSFHARGFVLVGKNNNNNNQFSSVQIRQD